MKNTVMNKEVLNYELGKKLYSDWASADFETHNIIQSLGSDNIDIEQLKRGFLEEKISNSKEEYAGDAEESFNVAIDEIGYNYLGNISNEDISSMTNLKDIMNKPLSMEVSENVKLHITVVSLEEVIYQYIGIDDNTKDVPVKTKLEIAYDDIEGKCDYSFKPEFNSRHFLFQFIN